ncbi:MAG: GNAT family N-acetyltransferase [Clostridia bacterium]|nr:GNAT family N-acetyltransferase [Clostridia bacterium]
MLKLIEPKYDELIFKQELLADEKTMAYNAKWGGAIDFSVERWKGWYDAWVVNPDRRFYRYLYSTEDKAFVGEVAFHFDDEFQCYICNLIIRHCFRGRGFGRAGLKLLLDEAREQGVTVIYDNIARDNPAVKLFNDCGFTEIWRNSDFIMLKREL